jgi:hypothetical protein
MLLMDNQQPQRHPQSHLFTVRLWVESLGHGQEEVRMRVRHVLSGETHYFREWPRLLSFLLAKMEEVEREDRSDADSP